MSQQPTPPPYRPPPPDHPQTTTILVLGICGLVLCQVLGPFAWSMGNKALREIDASEGRYGGRDTVNVGRILGIIGTIILGLFVLALVFFVVIAGIGIYSASG